MKFIFSLLMILAVANGCAGRVGTDQVVMLITPAGGGGTGFEVVAPSGKQYTLTNRHVCEDGATMARLGDEGRQLRVIKVSEKTDLCLLEGILERPALRISNKALAIGDKVDIYGYGLMLPLQHTSGEYVGYLPMSVLEVENAGYATATILPGNSGSPVLNRYGRVVGVAFATSESINHRAIFVSLYDIKAFLGPY